MTAAQMQNVSVDESSGLQAGTQGELIRLLSRKGEDFESEKAMREWLESKGINCDSADSRKGLHKLFGKIEKGEARLVYDELNERVIRAARVARISVEATIHGELYPIIELCQVFLDGKIDAADLIATDPSDVARIISGLKTRSVQIRDSQQIWETLVGDEDPVQGVKRGLSEELGLSSVEVQKVILTTGESEVGYEPPIDWPGIHSVLEIHHAKAALPEEISKPVFVELEGDDQITVFVAAPGAPVMRYLFSMLLPGFRYVSCTL